MDVYSAVQAAFFMIFQASLMAFFMESYKMQE